MNSLIEFADKIQELVNENTSLKTQLARYERFLQKAICSSDNSMLVTTAEASKYRTVLDNTTVSFFVNSKHTGATLVWKNKLTVKLGDRVIRFMDDLTQADINYLVSGFAILDKDGAIIANL